MDIDTMARAIQGDLQKILVEIGAIKDDIKKIWAVMATKEDIRQIRAEMATKEDLKQFATKQDLERFATQRTSSTL